MNRNRNLKIKLYINNHFSHVINDPENRHVQPHQPKNFATKPWKATHPKSEE